MAQRRGVARAVKERVESITDATRISLLREYGDDWDEQDFTMPYDPVERRQRYDSYPRWSRNSCALDACIIAAIQCDLVGTIAASTTWAVFLNLSEGCRAFREVIAYPWGKLTVDQRTQLRDWLASILSRDSRFKFVIGTFSGVGDLQSLFWDGNAQCSYTSVKVQICCDQQRTVLGTSKGRRVTGLQVDITQYPHTSIEDIIRKHFAAHAWDRHTPVQNCTQEDQCRKDPSLKIVALDRMPPRYPFNINPSPARIEDNATRQYFEDVTITYAKSSGQPFTIRYQVEACIIFTGSHFFQCSLSRDPKKGRIKVIDPYKKPAVSYIQNWLDVTRDQPKLQLCVSLLFYKLVRRD